MMLVSKLALTFLCLGCLGTAGWAITRELGVQSVLGGTWNDRVATLAAMRDDVPIGLSARSVRNLATACAELRHRAPALRSDPVLRERLSAACAQISERTLQAAPTNARSLSMALLVSPVMTVDDLTRAQGAAPFEPWPLRMRLWALSETTSLSPELLDAAGADFSSALRTDWGRALLARLYLEREDARPAILARAEAADAQIQRAFLSAVSSERRGGRSLDFNRG